MNAPAAFAADLAHPETQYLELLREVIATGVRRGDRTGTGTLSVFGRQMRFDLADGFPLLTTKRVHFRSVVLELAWFLKGTDQCRLAPEARLHDLGRVGGRRTASSGRSTACSGAPGPRRTAGHIDQIAGVLLLAAPLENPESSRRHDRQRRGTSPDDRRTWRCRRATAFFQFYVADGKLSCQLYQRSADLFLGVPFNMASYALLTTLVARATGLEPGEFIHTLGDAHLYLNHLDQAKLQVSREPLPFPTLVLPDVVDLFDLDESAIRLKGYKPHPAISAPIAV